MCNDISGKALVPWPDLYAQMRLPRGILGCMSLVVIVAILVNRQTAAELPGLCLSPSGFYLLKSNFLTYTIVGISVN